MNYLFAGLGNIGKKYIHTRHNVGFLIADSIAEEYEIKFNPSKLADVANFQYRGKSVYVIKPSTYMNLSGSALLYYTKYLKIPLERTLTLVDDIALPFGKIRIKGKGSHGGHNGLRNIQEVFNTNQYPRLRFGVGDDFSRGKQIDYVLGEWTKKQQSELASYVLDAKRAALSFVDAGLEHTMNLYN